MSEVVKDAKEILGKIRDFNVESLDRREELGSKFSFWSVIQDASKVQDFYGQLSDDVVYNLPDSDVTNIVDTARNSYQIWNRIMNFDPQSDSGEMRDGLIEQARRDYRSVFSVLYPFVSYSLISETNTHVLRAQLGSWIQQGRSDIEQIRSDLEDRLSNSKVSELEAEAGEIIENMREMSSEVGVSQRGIYFKEESDYHSEKAKNWKIAMFCGIGVLALYSVVLLIGYDWFILNGNDIQHEIQLVVGKVLLFAVFVSWVVISVRNFMSHTHNAIVNRHRQNALMTFKALVDASGDQASRDVILNHAASCIFSPQNTGYTKPDGQLSNIDPSIVRMISRVVKGVT